MRIVIATPLYPPDIAPQASYVKELAKRLSSEHTVTVVAYGSYPEEVPGVRIVSVSKQQPKLFRILAFTLSLYRETRRADVLYAENGPSVELPVGLLALLPHPKLVVHMGDSDAAARADVSIPHGKLLKGMTKRAVHVETSTPLTRPEILPFAPRPDQELVAYEESWKQHVSLVTTLCAL